MRLVMPLAALGVTALLATPAVAGDTGTLLVEKQGMFQTFVWVDGRGYGKVKKRKPLSLEVPAGWHEVWYSADPDGIVTLCHGLVNVPAGGQGGSLYRDRGCEGLTEGWPNGPSAFRGSEIRFRVAESLDAWVSIDGSQSMALPAMPFMLNLAPGTHSIVLYTDNFEEQVFDQGQVTLRGGERVSVTCTPAGCTGFDQPPVIMTELREVPQIQPVLPGVSLSLAIDVSVDGAGVQMGASVREGSQGASVGVSAGAGPTGGGVQMEVDVDETTGGARMDVSVDDGMGGGARIEMDMEASESGGGVRVEVEEQ
jgi:hypothetical protein